MTDANAAQAEYWGSAAGHQWIAREALLDTMMAGVLDRVLAHAAPQPGMRVLDIGCGTGASTLAAAQRCGPSGHATGVDIAAQLLDRARARAAAAAVSNVSFVLADAQTHDFATGSADMIISRFGVMFFDDPVAAFANMARALKPGGRMVFAAWAPIARVPWFRIPVAAAIARLGKPAPSEPHAAGPMAFQDPDRVCAILEQAGLTQVRCITESITLTPPGTAEQVMTFATEVGPAARIIAEHAASAADIKAIEAEVIAGFAPFQTDQGLRLPVDVHLYGAGV
jgi:SAM-dependent methyltransferase